MIIQLRLQISELKKLSKLGAYSKLKNKVGKESLSNYKLKKYLLFRMLFLPGKRMVFFRLFCAQK